jgi:tetratricopeptide (TPR) repeat protein
MDIQMLFAYNYSKLESYTEAERHLKIAANMIPSRFMPLYELVKLYELTERTEDAIALAQKIIDKDVKIPSRAVSSIKNYMTELIENNQIKHYNNDD